MNVNGRNYAGKLKQFSKTATKLNILERFTSMFGNLEYKVYFYVWEYKIHFLSKPKNKFRSILATKVNKIIKEHGPNFKIKQSISFMQ